MKKRLAALVLTAVMAVSLWGCGGGGANTQAPGEAESSEPKLIKVGMVAGIGGVEDGSFNQSAWEGLSKASYELPIEADYLECMTEDDFETNLKTYAESGYDLIVSVGYMLSEATEKIAKENPNEKFVIIDDVSIDLPNVTNMAFKQAQGAYLVGYVAGLMTQTDNIGLVLGEANPSMHQFGYGYCAGALDANPNVKIHQYVTDSYSDTAAGKSAANDAISKGADIIFHAAGATGLGVIEACQESGVYAIGVDSDQSEIAPNTIITSAMKRVDNAIYSCVKAYVEGTLEPGNHIFGLAEGGVDIAPTRDLIPDEVYEEVEDLKAQIIQGRVAAPETKEEFEEGWGDVYVLD